MFKNEIIKAVKQTRKDITNDIADLAKKVKELSKRQTEIMNLLDAKKKVDGVAAIIQAYTREKSNVSMSRQQITVSQEQYVLHKRIDKLRSL